ncbi:MAG: FliH/SctL family protein, partial [Planctomycetota bacterium]
EKLAEAEIDRQILNALPAVTAAVDAVADARDRFLVAQARVAVTLGVEIAARLLGRDETTLTEAAFAAAEEALDVAVADARYTLAFHPDDHARLAERLAVVVESAGRLGDVSFVADESVPPGGCVLDGPHGAIDARLQTRLDRITAELLPAA